MEGKALGARFLDLNRVAAGQRTDMVEHRLHAGIAARNGPVDALARKQQGPAYPICLAQREQRRTQRLGVIETRELVQRSNADRQVGHVRAPLAGLAAAYTPVHQSSTTSASTGVTSLNMRR